MEHITIRDARRSRKLRQVDLAEKTGYHQTTISDYEVGRVKPPSEAMEIIAKACRVSVKRLIATEKDRPSTEVAGLDAPAVPAEGLA